MSNLISFDKVYENYVEDCKGYEDCVPMPKKEYLISIFEWFLEHGYTMYVEG